jgi:hypothetical protein
VRLPEFQTPTPKRQIQNYLPGNISVAPAYSSIPGADISVYFGRMWEVFPSKQVVVPREKTFEVLLNVMYFQKSEEFMHQPEYCINLPRDILDHAIRYNFSS